MRLDTRLLLALNGLFKRPNFPDRPTPDAYSAWEYDETAFQHRLLEAAGVSLDVERALDLGCGMGGKTVYFAERVGGRTLGVDLSMKHVRAARAFAVARAATRTDFARADAAHLPLPDGSIDLIVTTDTFEHFAYPQPALSEMARVLRPGGRLAAVFGPFGSPLGSHLYDKIYIPWCHVLFARDALAEALREITRRRSAGLGPEDARREMQAVDEQIRYYDQDVNRMSLRRFVRVLRGEPRLGIRTLDKHPPAKLRPLRPLLVVPGLDEYLTGIVVMVAVRLK